MRNSIGGTRAVVFGLVWLLLAGCGGSQRAELPPLRGPGDSGRVDTNAGRTKSTPVTQDAALADPKCAIFEEIIRLDEAVEDRLARSLGQWDSAAERGDRSGVEVAVLALVADMQAVMAEEIPPLVGAYDRLLVVAPELSDDVVLVRDFTIETVDALASAPTSSEGFMAAVESLANKRAVEAGMATLRLDVVSQSDCGLILAN